MGFNAYKRPHQPIKSTKHVQMDVTLYSAMVNVHLPLIQALFKAYANYN